MYSFQNRDPMKAKNVIYTTTVMLIIAVALAHASPKEESPPPDRTTSVVSEPALMETSARLISAYNQSSQLEPVILSRVHDQGAAEGLPASATIALVTKNNYSRFAEGNWSMEIGRDVVIPVMHESHPDRNSIEQRGFTREQFTGMLQEEGLLYISSEQGVVTYVADFLGLDPNQIPDSQVMTQEQLFGAVQKNPQIVGFIRLSSVVEHPALSLRQGLALVPIDADGDGKLEHTENIYRSTVDLLHGIHIGKYPKKLYSRIYAVTRQKPVEGNDLAFLEWLVRDGQKLLPGQDLMGLSSFEKQTALRHLQEEPVTVAEVPLAASATRVILLIFGLLLTLILLVAASISWATRRKERITSAITSRPALRGENLHFPGGFFFDKTHTWAFMERGGKVRIGLDDFLLHVTGEVTRVEMKKPGDAIKKGDPMVKIIQQGKQLQIRAPLTGVVVQNNQKLKEDSAILNEAPYDEGWVYLVEPQQWLSETKGYVMGERYREWISKEFVRLKDFFSSGIALVVRGIPTPVMQEGGEVKYGIMELFGPEVWEEFQTSFINTSN
jgi:glycine cleavage system H lipoate-binding protein